MRRKLLLRKTFLRYFITYSLILLLPIMVLGSFTHLRFVKNMRENAARKQLDSLVNTVDVVDMKWSDLEQFLLQLQSNSLFSLRSLQKDSFQIMKAQNELHTFAISNSFAKDIFFYLVIPTFSSPTTALTILTGLPAVFINMRPCQILNLNSF